MSKTKIFLDTEFTERERLLELQRSKTRWFSQEEFDRLKELSNKFSTSAPLLAIYLAAVKFLSNG